MSRLPIVYEDDAMIAFDKPAGLLVAPDRWDKSAVNLMDLVHRHISPDCFNAHRIDRDTSGLLVCAKHRDALAALSREFERRRVGKRYVCLARGGPSEDERTVTLALAPDAARPGCMKPVRRGRRAETRFRVLKRWRGCALLEAVPVTGRTHQIRVHAAASGFPIVGDPLYGDGRGIYLSDLKRNYKRKAEPEKPLIGRLALHAESLDYVHPSTGERVTLRAPLPHDFELAIKYLDRFAS
jgi:RluA family pseudouridine synthase